MYIELNQTGLTLSDLICVAHRKRSEDTGFPYAVQSCRCSNCRYVSAGKCSLKECCCMAERVKAHTCTFAEILHTCFANVKDNAKLKIVDKATTPKAPTSPSVSRNVMIAFAAGLIISLIISFVRDILDVKIKYNDEMTTVLDLPLLAAIPDFEYFSNQKAAEKKYGDYESGY